MRSISFRCACFHQDGSVAPLNLPLTSRMLTGGLAARGEEEGSGCTRGGWREDARDDVAGVFRPHVTAA